MATQAVEERKHVYNKVSEVLFEGKPPMTDRKKWGVYMDSFQTVLASPVINGDAKLAGENVVAFFKSKLPASDLALTITDNAKVIISSIQTAYRIAEIYAAGNATAEWIGERGGRKAGVRETATFEDL